MTHTRITDNTMNNKIKIERPKKYTIIDIETRKHEFTDFAPNSNVTHRWVATENNPNVFIEKEVKKVYIDTRYPARLRLYKMTLKRLDPERYEKEFCRSVYYGTEIGKSIPILNF